jgi:hypothetical protein
MDKVIRDGKVAVLVSGGYGAGWSTWFSGNRKEVLLFHPKIVEMVEGGRKNEIKSTWIEQELGLKDVYVGGVEGLYIEWIPVGTKFVIDEYDGAELLRTIDNYNWITA